MATTVPVIGRAAYLFVLLLPILLTVDTSGQHQPEADRTHLRRRHERRYAATSDNSSNSLEAAEAMRRCQQQQLQQSAAMPAADPQLTRLLAKHFRLPDESSAGVAPDLRAPLPRPSNVSVLIISWYPPVLKLSWELKELGAELEQVMNASAPSKSPDAEEDYEDVDVNLDELSKSSYAEVADKSLEQEKQQQQRQRLLQELRLRRLLLKKALTCFQVTYNIINSRFKVAEEYPAYLRSVLLERLLPATEYSLQVSAVYLDGRHRLTSDRVQFVSPADNESRRFKENTYRPVHRYPDLEQSSSGPQRGVQSRLGTLGQVRSEEITLVAIALLFWAATICLFFNKWGKIRMLEPYQPAYREACLGVEGVVEPVVEPTVAAYASLHHPSLHNLGMTGGKLPAGSGGGAGCCTDHGSVSLAGSERSSQTRNSCGCSQNQSELTAVAKTSLTSKAPGSGDQLPAQLLVTASKRTEAELQFLFQAKAQQLAKATGFWSARSRHLNQSIGHQPTTVAGHQRHRQQQYRAQHVDLEMLRRTSQALLRQRQLSVQCGAAQQQQNSTQFKSCAGGNKNAQLASSVERPSNWPAGQSPALGVGATSSPAPTPPHNVPSNPAQSCDLPQRGDSSGLAASNKLRRLLFISKSHRHHHVATSNSSVSSSQPTTAAAINSRQLAETTKVSQANRKSNNNGTKPGSLSLDAVESVGARSGFSGNPGGLSHHHHRTKHRQPSTESAPAAHIQLAPIQLTSGQPQQHHILIEPPSPPKPRDLLELRATTKREQGGSLLAASKESSASQWTGGSASGTIETTSDTRQGLSMGPNGQGQTPELPMLSQRQRLLSWAGDGGRDNEFSEATSSDHDNHYTTRATTAHNGQDDNSNSNNAGGDKESSPGAQQPAICLEEAPSLQPSPQLTPTVSANSNLAQWAAGIQGGSTRCHSSVGTSEPSSRRTPLGHQHQMSQSQSHRDAFEELAAYQCQQRGWCLAAERGRLGASMQLAPALGSQSSLLMLGQCARRHQSFGAPSYHSHSPFHHQQAPSPSPFPSPSPTPTRAQQAQLNNHTLELVGAYNLGACAGGAEPSRPRISSVFVASPYSRAHRDSFAMLRALSQKKSKSAEDVAYLSQLVLQIWARDRNPLLQSVSQQQLSQSSMASDGGQAAEQPRRGTLGAHLQQSQERHQAVQNQRRPKSSLTVAHM